MYDQSHVQFICVFSNHGKAQYCRHVVFRNSLEERHLTINMFVNSWHFSHATLPRIPYMLQDSITHAYPHEMQYIPHGISRHLWCPSAKNKPNKKRNPYFQRGIALEHTTGNSLQPQWAVCDKRNVACLLLAGMFHELECVPFASVET